MRLVLVTAALVGAAALIVPASAVSTVEIVQQKLQAKSLSEKKKRERCFVRCWNSCWGLYCVERCRCRCSNAKPDYCAKLI